MNIVVAIWWVLLSMEGEVNVIAVPNDLKVYNSIYPCFTQLTLLGQMKRVGVAFVDLWYR